MTRACYIIFTLTALLISCAHEKEPENEPLVSAVDHIRWGSGKNPLEQVTVSWRSNGTSDKIRWGYSETFEIGEYPALKDSDNVGSANKYEYVFVPLHPSSVIYYELYDSEISSWTDYKTFRTAPDPANNHFIFSAGGDSRTNVKDWHNVSKTIERCDFSIFLGDICADGITDQDWESWYKEGEKFLSDNLVFYTRGNHDIGDIYLNNLVNPGNRLYYSFEFGNSLFICLDFPESGSWNEQAVFLEDVLKKNTDKTWKFVFFHAPFFTSGIHMHDMDSLRTSWWKLFDDYGVDFVFNAHEHSYLRTVPINLNISDTCGVAGYGSGPAQGRCQIISGQYGAPFYNVHQGWFVAQSSLRLHYTTIEVNGNELKFRAIDTRTGEEFDSLQLKK
jgi:hypothetical protein